MKVKELIELLEYEDGEMEVLFKPANSYYVENISEDLNTYEVNRFYGDPKRCLIIFSDGQVGSI